MNSNLIEIRKTRQFGFIGFFFFATLCFLSYWTANIFCYHLFGILSFITICLFLFPSYLKPVYCAWIKIAISFGIIINCLILIFVYYFAITPVGILKRICNCAEISRKPDRQKKSYWVIKENSIPLNERFTKRY